MKKSIEELITLTAEQEQLCKEIEDLYARMQRAGIAFTTNDNGELVAYNAKDISDCAYADVWGKGPDGYEYAEQNDMKSLFPIWVFDSLFLKRK